MPRKTVGRDRNRQWRERVPELRRIIEDVAPRIHKLNHEQRVDEVPDAWRALVATMREEVRAKAATFVGDDLGLDERRGYEWSWKIGRVADMLEYVMRVIREDIELGDGATLGSMVLVKQAMLQLQLELQDGGTRDGREDREELRYRVANAVRALSPRFDDMHLRRFRALQVAEYAAASTNIPVQTEVDDELTEAEMGHPVDRTARSKQREFIEIDRPMMSALFARDLLAETDERFRLLDPLIVLEELDEAHPRSRGGKLSGGDGRIGPVRALARLAVRCGALGYEPREGEDFDAAVDRARGNLLVTRSRIRSELRDIPGQLPPEAPCDPDDDQPATRELLA